MGSKLFQILFLKLANITFNEQLLENDFQILIRFLKQADRSHFMYRDFQARNIMIYKNEPWFIDYQGGRKGPLQYDLASLLFQAKADLPFEFRQQMLEYYIDELKNEVKTDRSPFIAFYYGFVLIRTLQVLGAYGFRGFFERKPHFVESIQYAIMNLSWLIENVELPLEMPELNRCLNEIIASDKSKTKKQTGEDLVVEINSFSYIYGQIPEDKSGHGGGFVFDCRSLPNPGRYAEYKQLSGLDKPVIDFLKKEPAVDLFNQSVSDMVCQSVDTYIERGFDHLMINFGCTGGQHRSVYCAEQLYSRLKGKYNIQMNLNHLMKDRWKQ
ncbi:MAG: RNase adapter RapZ [Bacteroidales bacterium]